MPQVQVQLSDQLYNEAKIRANAEGFESVDEYITDVVQYDLDAATEDLDHLFTPSRLAQIDKAAAQIKAGDSLTSDQVKEYFKQKRITWSQDNLP